MRKIGTQQIIQMGRSYLNETPYLLIPTPQEAMADDEANNKLATAITKAKELDGYVRSQTRTVKIRDPATGRVLADVLVNISIREPANEEPPPPFRLSVDVRGEQVEITSELIKDDDERDSLQTTASSKGVQVDLPYMEGFTERDPSIYKRMKFRPEKLNQYGLEEESIDSDSESIATTVMMEHGVDNDVPPPPYEPPESTEVTPTPMETAGNKQPAGQPSNVTSIRRTEITEASTATGEAERNICVRFLQERNTWVTIQGSSQRKAAKTAQMANRTLMEEEEDERKVRRAERKQLNKQQQATASGKRPKTKAERKGIPSGFPKVVVERIHEEMDDARNPGGHDDERRRSRNDNGADRQPGGHDGAKRPSNDGETTEESAIPTSTIKT
ncbi:uncharacterized protein LOC143893740 [Temnothorax americanus]|uniref:uncharacterized protein LOC143893740 n=1 Tax=Temnothorax americanus TaxID=1964332 RepID=UPI0040691892